MITGMGETARIVSTTLIAASKVIVWVTASSVSTTGTIAPTIHVFIVGHTPCNGRVGTGSCRANGARPRGCSCRRICTSLAHLPDPLDRRGELLIRHHGLWGIDPLCFQNGIGVSSRVLADVDALGAHVAACDLQLLLLDVETLGVVLHHRLQ